MNEIKFRAWEKQLKEIIPVYNIDFRSKLINRGSVWRFFHEIELMQSTGLKDKNGVEIYEGDILTGIKNTKLDLYVEWEKNECYFCLKTISGFPHKKLTLNNVNKCEVIGNIYENKELLEDK